MALLPAHLAVSLKELSTIIAPGQQPAHSEVTNHGLTAEEAIADWDSRADMSYSSVSLHKFMILCQCLDALYHYLHLIQLLLGQAPRSSRPQIQS